MKPVSRKLPFKRIKVIKLDVWECGLDHSHRTRDVAQRCIDVQNREKRVPNVWHDEKYLIVLRMRRAGKTFKEIGETFGISSGHAGIVFKQAEIKLEGKRPVADIVKYRVNHGRIEELSLPLKVEKILKLNKIFYIRDLITLSEIDLRKFPNMQRASIRLVIRALENRGLSLPRLQ